MAVAYFYQNTVMGDLYFSFLNPLHNNISFSFLDEKLNADLFYGNGFEYFSGNLVTLESIVAGKITSYCSITDIVFPIAPLNILDKDNWKYNLKFQVENISVDVGSVIDKINQTTNVLYGGGFNYNPKITAGAGEIEDIVFSGNDTFYGSNLDDRIIGYAGNDTIFGGYGNDTLVGGSGNDYLSGGGGLDTVEYSGDISDYDITAIMSFSNIEGFYIKHKNGLDGLDYIQSDIEFISFNSGKNIYKSNVLPFNSEVKFDEGMILYNTSEGEFLAGSSGSDTIIGSVKDDVINGGDGDDVLIGGYGNDYIVGGNGSDIAKYSSQYTNYTINSIYERSTLLGFQIRDISGRDGVDWLDISVEFISFNNGSVFYSLNKSGTISLVVPNHAPYGSDKTVSFLEDASYTFGSSDFGFFDSDGNTLSTVKISSLPSVGQLKYNGIAITTAQVSSGYEVSASDLTSGKLVYTPVANANGTAYSTFKFQVRDNGGTMNGGVDLDQTANTITFNVTSVNDAPSGSDKTVSVAVNGSYSFTSVDFGFTDVDNNSLASVKIDTLPTVGQLKYNGVALTSAQLSAGYEVSATDLSAGKLTYKPALGGSGFAYSSFAFQVRDNGGTTNSGVDLDPSANTITFSVAGSATNQVTGTSSNDNLKGTTGNDSISAGGGNDLITATLGTDTVDGGAGTDTIVFSGNYSAYTLVAGSNGAINVTSSSLGSDVVSNVERFQFKDNWYANDTNANNAAQVIYAAFGKDYVKPFLATGISMADSGMSLNDLCVLVTNNHLVEAISGDSTTKGYVNTIFNNVVGRLPNVLESLSFTSQIDSGSMTKLGLLELVAAHSLTVTDVNALKIDLIGIPYNPGF